MRIQCGAETQGWGGRSLLLTLMAGETECLCKGHLQRVCVIVVTETMMPPWRYGAPTSGSSDSPSLILRRSVTKPVMNM